MKLWFAVAVALLSAPVAAGPAAITPFPPEWPHRAPWKLNEELLLPKTERIVFVVDVPRGFPPKAEALDALASLAREHGGREGVWVRLGEPGAPDVVWKMPAEPRPAKLHARRIAAAPDPPHLDHDATDSIRYFGEVPSCPDGPLPENASFVFVRYLGDWGRDYGAADTVVSEPSCGGREFRVLYLAQGRIARERAPGMSQTFLESRALAHEYGHALGLGSNPAHGRWGSVTPYGTGPHCVNRECAVAVPTAAALLEGKMLDYCADCRRDMAQAREHWLEGKEFPEVSRLPQPDPVAALSRLKAYNFREGGLADGIVGFGKGMMPALMARLPSFPGGSAVSPRGDAAILALRIVADENEKRGGDALDPRWLARERDMSAELLAWWAREHERFLAGDDWTLPKLAGD